MNIEKGKILERCSRCHRKLLLNEENHLCISCENDHLREQVATLELQLAQSRRKRQELYTKLSQARAQNVSG